LPFEMESAVIFAAVNGYFDTFAPDEVSAIERKLQDYLLREAGDVLAKIRETREIGEEAEKSLRSVLEKFLERAAK
jgi:F-type H+-transporting ATPase subunit alpha